MILDVMGLVASLAVLTVAGDQFVIGLARIAAVLRVRPTVVGAVIGGFGTSLPDLIVSAVATVRRTPLIALGSMVGSIVANVSLALAIAALIAPIRVDSLTLRREAPLCVLGVLLFAGLASGGISEPEGAILAVALVGSLVVLLLNALRAPARDELGTEVTDFFGPPKRRLEGKEAGRTGVGVVMMVAGAEVLVRSSVDLAGRLGLAEGFVGLTLVAIGTSAPLIASSIQAARRGAHDLVVGNVLGCCLFIALAGGPIVALLPGGAPAGIGAVPLWLMASLIVAAWVFMTRRKTVTRWEAVLLVVAYGATLPFFAR